MSSIGDCLHELTEIWLPLNVDLDSSPWGVIQSFFLSIAWPFQFHHHYWWSLHHNFPQQNKTGHNLHWQICHLISIWWNIQFMVLNISLQPQLWLQRQGILINCNGIMIAITAASVTFSRNVKVFWLTTMKFKTMIIIKGSKRICRRME